LAVLTVYGIAAAIPGRDAVLVLVLAGVASARCLALVSGS